MAKKTPSKSTEETPQEETPGNEKKEVIECGLVMPISEIDGCSASHWETVKKILIEALDCDYLKTTLVSDADESGIIHNRIIQNLYTNPIVVCDVSGKNPNVMFELGLRLAFDMPTVVVKDDATKYSFDTSPIEHVPYPRSLDYPGIVKFMKALKEKVNATLEKKRLNDNYSSFLGNYQIEKVANIKTTEVSSTEFLMEKIAELSDKLDRISRQNQLNQHKPIEPSIKRSRYPRRSYEYLSLIDYAKVYDVVISGGVIATISGQKLSTMVDEGHYKPFIDPDNIVHLLKGETELGKD